jgi:hypothetical protein
VPRLTLVGASKEATDADPAVDAPNQTSPPGTDPQLGHVTVREDELPAPWWDEVTGEFIKPGTDTGGHV